MKRLNLLLSLVLIFVVVPTVLAQVPTVQDCLGAIPVCQDIYYEENTYTGTGNYPNEIYEPPGQCSNYCPNSCLDGEQNSVWYVFTVQQGGYLRLTIDPEVDSDDYDWVLYDLSLLRCGDIYGHPLEMQVSCNAAGGSGYQGNTGINSSNGGSGDCNNCGTTNKWNADLWVDAGKTYVLSMNNWAGAGAQGGYTLDFSASSAIIYDDIRPELEDVLEEEVHCGVDYIVCEFSENVECSSVNPGDFNLDGPGGPYDIIDVHGEACDLGGDMEKRYTLYLDKPIDKDGDYSLTLSSSCFVYDACGNFAIGNTIVFAVELGAPVVSSSSLNITPATCGLANGSITGLLVTGTPPLQYTWINMNGDTVGNEVDLVNVPGDEYTLYVTDENTCMTISGPHFVDETGGPELDASAMVITSATFNANNGSITGLQTNGTEPMDYEWTDENSQVVGSDLELHNAYTGNYHLRVIDDYGCDTVGGPYFIPETGGPLVVNVMANPQRICVGSSTQLQAQPSGGSGDYTYSWSSQPGSFTSTIPSPVVEPTVTTTYTVSISDGFNITEGQVTVTVDELPVADAGADQTIPHGTSTLLLGNGSVGSGDYDWHWEPSDKLINPNVQNPATKNLYESSLFTLVITDNETGCVSEASNVTVSLDGGPLSVTAQALDPQICAGQQTTLVALPGGGNFPHYTYSWSSNQGGGYPSDSMITVSPATTTTYYVLLDDGYNTIQGEVTVTVLAGPDFQINNGSDQILACPYDTVILSTGNTQPGWSYLWSDGSTTPSVSVGTTGIGFDIKEFEVRVTTGEGCESVRNVTVIFDFASCLGIGENDPYTPVTIYPNPTNGEFTMEIEDVKGYKYFSISDSQGREIYKVNFEQGQKGEYSQIIDLSSFPSGIYMMRLVNESFIQFGKILKE